MFGAEYLHVIYVICILGVFEPCTWLDVIKLYFEWVEFFLAPCTDRAISEEHFFPQFSLFWPVFTGMDAIVTEEAFTLNAFLDASI